MASGSISIRVMSEEDRDAIDSWDEGDIVFIPGTGFTFLDDQGDWQQLATLLDIPVP